VNSIIQYRSGPGRNSKKNPRKFLVAALDFTAAKIRRDSSTAKYCLVLSLYLPVLVVLAAARVATIILDGNLQCAARSNWMENVPPIGGLGFVPQYLGESSGEAHGKRLK
jgi:hypothetical protein